jgi:hypothetical protein
LTTTKEYCLREQLVNNARARGKNLFIFYLIGMWLSEAVRNVYTNLICSVSKG